MSADPSHKLDLAALEPGAIVITAATNVPEISASLPNRRVQPEPAGDRAADTTRSFLNTPNLGNPQLEAGVGAVQFALAPFAAAYGAISARAQRLSPDQVAEAQQALAQTLKTNAQPEQLVQHVTEIARQKTRRLLFCNGWGTNAPSSRGLVSAVLEISLTRFELKATSPGGAEYVLSIAAKARLLRTADRRVLLERSYHYDSGPGWYTDWTRHRGLEDVAQTGYQVLAAQIAQDVFEPASAPPLLIGPGQSPPKTSSLGIWNRSMAERRGALHGARGWRNERQTPEGLTRCVLAVNAQEQELAQPAGLRRFRLIRRLGRASPAQSAPAFRFVSQLQEEVGSVEVHTGKTDERLRSPKPGPQSGSNSPDASDTTWSLDGLQEDRNAVVQGLACVAAVPFGLWEQTVGVAGNRSRERLEEYSRTLNAATTQQHLEGDLADEVARCLHSRVADSVSRTEAPLRFGVPSAASGRAPVQTNSPAPARTALEIQVLSTKLVGKHHNSRVRAVLVEVQATVFRTSDGQEVYSRPIRYQSSSRRLKDWAAADARLVRQELDTCSRQTAQALVSDLMARGFVTSRSQANAAILEQKSLPVRTGH